jgi:hypothetical protein
MQSDCVGTRLHCTRNAMNVRMSFLVDYFSELCKARSKIAQICRNSSRNLSACHRISQVGPKENVTIVVVALEWKLQYVMYAIISSGQSSLSSAPSR